MVIAICNNYIADCNKPSRPDSSARDGDWPYDRLGCRMWLNAHRAVLDKSTLRYSGGIRLEGALRLRRFDSSAARDAGPHASPQRKLMRVCLLSTDTVCLGACEKAGRPGSIHSNRHVRPDTV